MRCVLLVLAILVGCVATRAMADEPLGDVQDILFLGESRPVLIRLHFRIDGKPYRQAWEEFLDQLFKHLDRDGDGVLSQEELDRAPTPQQLQGLFQGEQPAAPNMQAVRPEPELSVSLVGGKVTRRGLGTYYRLSKVEPLQGNVTERSYRTEALTDALIKNLDTDRDGKLSRAEIEAAPKTLRKLDLNDDDIVSVEEILPPRDDDMRMMQMEKTTRLAGSLNFVLVSGDELAGRVTYALLAHYDKDRNNKLSPAELPIDRALFDRLDANHDGVLDASEMVKLVEEAPDLELAVSLGKVSAGAADIQLVSFAPQKGVFLAVRTRPGGLELVFRESRLALEVPGGSDAAAFHKAALDQFDKADAKKRGFLEHSQVPDDAVFGRMFAFADRDGDGKLTRAEWEASLDLLEQAAARSVRLNVAEEGRDLFDLMSEARDGKLRTADLRAAWERLAPWDKNGDGYLTKEEIPRSYRIVFSQGFPPAPATLVASAPAAAKPGAASKGPLWFQKMDRNGDGLVSQREFLGSKEDFKKIDTNGDGFISPDEADRYDAQMRKQSPGTPAASGTKSPGR